MKQKRRPRHSKVLVYIFFGISTCFVIRELIIRQIKPQLQCTTVAHYSRVGFTTDVEWEPLEPITEANSWDIEHLATLQAGKPVSGFSVDISPDSRFILVHGVPAGISTVRHTTIAWNLNKGLNCLISTNLSAGFIGFSPDGQMIFLYATGDNTSFESYDVQTGWRIDTSTSAPENRASLEPHHQKSSKSNNTSNRFSTQ